jgi:predicted  nucleic acid-binding Zn-ribbon protein
VLEFPSMHPALPRLLDLQQIDHRIAALRTELDAFPKRIRDADAQLSGARASLAAAKEAHTNGLKERKKLELDVEQWKERARKYRDQSGAVKTNEAYKALLHEIANAEAETGKAEDRQLDVMMAAEDLDRRVKNSEINLKQAEQSVATERKNIESQRGVKQEQMAVAVAERERALVAIPTDLLELYTRIAKRHNGTGMAEARDGQCRGCGMRVLPHILQELKQEANEDVYRCESCGLILYSLEPVATPKSGAEPGSTASSVSRSS